MFIAFNSAGEGHIAHIISLESIADVTQGAPYFEVLEALVLEASGCPFTVDTANQRVIILPRPLAIPAKISRFQARAVLLQRGLLASVEAAVATADPLTQLAWAETIEWQRDSPTLEAIAVGVLGMSPEQIDEMFIEAAQIRA